MHFSTNISGNRLTFRCHEALRLQAEWLLSFVRNIADETGAEVLRDGKTIQFGWSVLTVVKLGTGSFVLLEPDFSGDPFHGVRDDLECTLGVQADQSTFSLKIGVEPIITSFQDKVVYSRSCIRERSIYLERKRPRPTDSGWFIGSNRADNSHDESDELAVCYAYELLRLRPEVMKVLQLPPGYLVVFDGPDVEAVLARDDETVFSR